MTKSRACLTGRPTRRGAALVAALTIVMVISMVVLSFFSASLDSSRQTSQQSEQFRLKIAAESVVSLSVYSVWSTYLNLQGGQPGDMASFRDHLDALGIADLGDVAGAPETLGTDVAGIAALPLDKNASEELTGIRVDSLTVARRDLAESSELYFRSSVSLAKGADVDSLRLREDVRQVYAVEGGYWPGLDFALLANNVNCIMCHAQIDTAERFYNTDPALYGTFPRVKVATLEQLLLRSGADSVVGGTLYVRGRAIDKSGVPISDWAGQTVKSLAFDAQGNVVEDFWGDTTVTDLVPAGADPQPLENLYIDYSSDEALMVDGIMPESFPPIFADDGGIDEVTGDPVPSAIGNRMVDDSEFAVVAAKTTGSLTGGVIHLVAPGDTISTTLELGDATTINNQASLGSGAEGTVFLTGTDSDPILLNGTVAIQGDLVIQGVVKGRGALFVSGNVYVPTDLLFLDGTDVGGRTYGKATDGTINSLAIASGGSIVIGDLFYQKGGDPAPTGDESGSFGFVLSEVALFNRGEWAKTQALLPGSADDPTDPSTWTVPNPGHVSGYFPRYYTFNDGGTVPIYNKDIYFDGTTGSWVGKEHTSDWDTAQTTLAHPSNPADPILYNPDGTPKAAVHSLTATGAWMSDNLLHTMMTDAIAARMSGDPLEVDALLYSNNSIFGIVSSSGPMQGRMIVNGGIVSPDIGLLAPGNGGVGLNLNYDERAKDTINLTSSDALTIRRKLWVSTRANP